MEINGEQPQTKLCNGVQPQAKPLVKRSQEGQPQQAEPLVVQPRHSIQEVQPRHHHLEVQPPQHQRGGQPQARQPSHCREAQAPLAGWECKFTPTRNPVG